MKKSVLFILAVFAVDLFGFTTVSRLPDLDYLSMQPRIVGWGYSALVLPEFENQDVYQLEFDGWEWNILAEHPVQEWTGNNRLNPRAVYPAGGEVLILGSDPQVNDLSIPRLNVLHRTGGVGLFEVVQRVSLASLIDDPEIFGFSLLDTVVLDGIMVMTAQVDRTGIGADIMVFTFVRTEAGWVVGPTFDPVTGYWWPLHAAEVDGSLHLWTLGLVAFSGSPYSYSMVEYKLQDTAWVMVSEFPFQHDYLWAGSEGVRTVVSGDGSSMILYRAQFRDNICMELKKEAGGWTYVGPVNGGALDMSDLYFEAGGDGYALMRRGEASSVGGPEPQRYHILRYVDGEWKLSGDLSSHRYLGDYYDSDIFYVFGPDFVTIFDIKPYYPTTREARGYNLDNLNPRPVKWFRNSETVDSTTEHLDAFGYFKPQFTESGSGLWVWHWNLGWLYLSGRSEQQFWFWNQAYGWALCNEDLFNMAAGFHWLYAWNQADTIWCVPASANPRYFYSYKLGEWLSDTVPEPMTEADVNEVLALLAEEMQQQGVTVEVDYPNRIATMTAVETVDGSQVVVRIDAPFNYLAGTGYPCQATFEVDFSWIEVTIDNEEPVYINSTDLWTESGVLLPMHLTAEFIFHTRETGVVFQTILYNDGSQEGPVRETFQP